MDHANVKKKISIFIVEDHNDALQFIYSAIGGKKLPVEGTTLLHLDAHPDLLVSRNLMGADARQGRKVLPLLEIENWIVPATAAGFISRVIWIRSPWSKQMEDGTRDINVGDDPITQLLRVDSTEPYYLSDAVYSKHLNNKKKFTLTVAPLGDPNASLDNEELHVQCLTEDLHIQTPFVLDIDLDFFSTGNPFLDLYKNIDLYNKLEDIFKFEMPKSQDSETIERFVKERDKQLHELEQLFQFLEEHGSLVNYFGNKSTTFEKVNNLAREIQLEADKLEKPPDWWAVYAAGCTRDQGGLPHHISTRQQINNMINRSFRSFLKSIPTPALITIARSSDDGYCPPDQVDYIQEQVIQELNQVFNIEKPTLYYLQSS